MGAMRENVIDSTHPTGGALLELINGDFFMRLRLSTQRIRVNARRARRGVVAILAMMFLVLFGSLAAAMAIVSQGNLQTAQTQLRVHEALGAVDTGLTIATARLNAVTIDLRIEKGVVDPDYAMDLWTGTYSEDDGAVQDRAGVDQTDGIVELLTAVHGDDTVVNGIDVGYTPLEGWLVTNPILLETNVDGDPVRAAQITYVPLDGEGGVRAVVTGYSWDYTSGRWISRSAQQDFRIFKRVDHAILGPSKIMVGRNVQINGPLGATFTGVEHVDGHPLVVHSDFLGLSSELNDKLEDLYAAITDDDTDGDNRLRKDHTVESDGLASLNAEDYDGDGDADQAFTDVNGDGSIDEFDIFLQHYDQDGDGKLVLSEALTAGTGADGEEPEFGGVDDDLAYLLDSAMPDRNGDGKVNYKDTVLGYRDGVIDYKDRYAKIRGSIAFRVGRDNWEANEDALGVALGDYQGMVEGVIRPDLGDQPIEFSAGYDVLPDIDTDTFDSAETALADAADGESFATQAGLSGAAFSLSVDGDGVVIGQVFNAGLTTVVEATPYGGAAPADYYERPVFQDITFKNVVIPRGLNALFVNCTFVGVTRVESYSANTHPSWQFYGQQFANLELKYPPPPMESEAQLDNDYFTAGIIQPDEFDLPRLTVGDTPYVTTKPLSNNIRFHNCLFVGSIVSDRPTNYTHIRNKLQFTGSTKFHTENPEYPDDDDLNPDADDLDEIAKSSMLAPHYSVDIGSNNAPTTQDVNLSGLVIAGVLDVRGNTSIDGALLLTFEPSLSDPALQHFGTPVGNPAHFNATLGYFGPEQGDEEGFNLEGLADLDGDGTLDIGWDANGDGFPDEGADPETSTAVPFNGFGRVVLNWDPNLVMPDGLIAPIQIRPLATSYREGRLIVEAN